MSFFHLHFRGRTITPWHVGKFKYGDYLYTRRDYLWGRGIRGPVLRQLWRSYCHRSDISERVKFNPEEDCLACGMAAGCPFNNMRGSPDEGEFKDRPRVVITNLRFVGGARVERIPIVTLDDKNLAIVSGRAPVFVECLSKGTQFEFESILTGDGAVFLREFESAVKVSLRFHGWGGFCNEGLGRGEIEDVEVLGFEEFERKYLEPTSQKLMERTSASFAIEPMLMLDRPEGGYYRSVLEEGFKEKLSNCLNERHWQFYGKHIYIRLNRVSGLARTTTIQGWSRKRGERMSFTGIGGELTLDFGGKPSEDEALALSLARYGIGRFKNQGFGSLRLKEVR